MLLCDLEALFILVTYCISYYFVYASYYVMFYFLSN